MKIGDVVKRRITTTAASSANNLYEWEREKHPGTVVYIHPKHRFYVVEFTFESGAIREAYPFRRFNSDSV